jgi:hypothetical protein
MSGNQLSQSAEVVSSTGEGKRLPNLVDSSQLTLFSIPLEKTTPRSPRSANAIRGMLRNLVALQCLAR